MPPAVVEALTERQKEITEVLQTKEDQAREMASTRVTLTSQAKSPKTQLLAGTLAETIAASSRWAPDASSVDIEELKRESASIKRAALIRDLELRLLYVSITLFFLLVSDCTHLLCLKFDDLSFVPGKAKVEKS